jgi:hypothetical protein
VLLKELRGIQAVDLVPIGGAGVVPCCDVEFVLIRKFEHVDDGDHTAACGTLRIVEDAPAGYAVFQE